MSNYPVVCRGCQKEDHDWEGKPSQHYWARADHYGIYTGIYCDECYDSDRYPYKKHAYESELNHGEYLYEEDY